MPTQKKVFQFVAPPELEDALIYQKAKHFPLSTWSQMIQELLWEAIRNRLRGERNEK